MQIGISVVAVVVKTEHLALTVVVILCHILCQCHEMDVEEEQCVAIKFCCKVDFLAKKTVELIQKAYSDAALSRTTIFEWHKRFREGRESVKNDEHSGRPTISPTTSSPSTKWSKKMGTRSFLGVRCGKVRLGRDTDHSPPSSAEVQNRVELYLYSP